MSSNETKYNLDWNLKTLEDLGEFARGKSKHRPRDDKSLFGGIYPFVQTGDVKSSILNLREYSTTYNEKGLSQSKLWEKGTLCITIAANIAETAVLDIDACFPDSVVGFTPNEDALDAYFMHYLFCYIKRMIQRSVSGSVQDNINLAYLKNLTFRIPDLSERKSLTSVLKIIDEKIELNNKINQTLEEMAQALFKSWFVDFEPFQDGEFQDSELGIIPKGWRIYELGEIVDIVNGYSYKGVELKESNDVLMTIKNFDRNGGFKTDGFKEIEISDKVKDRHYLNLFDVVIACTDLTQNAEIIGNPVLVLTKSKYNKLIASMDLVRILPKVSNITNCILYTLLKNENFKQFALGYTSGTTVLHLDKKGILQYRIALPSDKQILMNFSCAIEPLFKLISEKINESEKIMSIRNNLLPKLMSGAIRVPLEEVQ